MGGWFYAALQEHGDTIGISVALLSVVMLILRQLSTGRILFRKQFEEMRLDKDAEIARTVDYYDKLASLRADQALQWRTAYENEAEARADQSRSLTELVALARAADHMLRSLPSSVESGPG
jgi:hypothetical protein